MSDTPEGPDEGSSFIGKKFQKLAEKDTPPKVDDGILSPYRDQITE